ncbi:MAG: toxic anion resistance protein [Clostridiaceae bacterium]
MRFSDDGVKGNNDKDVYSNNLVKQDNSLSKDNEIEERLAAIDKELRQSKEVIDLSQKIDVTNINSIMQFGNEPAVEISKFSDRILNSIKVNSVENSGVMLKELTKVMKRFDKEELEEKPEGFFARVFNSGKKTVDQLLSKYQTLGGEIDKIYSRISLYKTEIDKTNKMLEEMFAQNFEFYKQLEKHVIACNLVVEELEKEDLPYWENKASLGSADDNLKLQEVRYSIEMLKQRVYDLEMAKMVSMQAAPQIRTIQKGNYKLIGKIHSAFIVTIPIFKNGLIQAVTLKRQKAVAESMDALDKVTNDLLIKNAQNIKDQSISIAKLSCQPSIRIETLETTWNTIMEGIDETERIEEENKKLRKEGIEKLTHMKVQLIKKYS